MRSHDPHQLDNAPRSRKRRLFSKEKSDRSPTRSRWPGAAISCGKKSHNQTTGDSKSNLEPTRFNGCPTLANTNDSNVIACEIVELYCKNDDANGVALEKRTTCPRISSSIESESKEAIDVCSSCKDCAECQAQANAVKIRREETGDLTNGRRTDQELAAKRFDYCEMASTSSTVATVIEHETPILVDLTSEESKVAWKQTILKRFGSAKNSEIRMGEDAVTSGSSASPCAINVYQSVPLLSASMSNAHPCIMIADSSSRLQRGGTGGSLATALRDRGPCVIPVQPNRSLPIRPAPPMPTRSASIVTSRKTRSPVLKLSKSANLDVVEVQSEKSLSGALTNELNEFPYRQRERKSDGMMLTSELIDRSGYILPDVTNVMEINQEVGDVKRRNNEDRDRENETETTKDVKKRKKYNEIDANHLRVERVENILREYSRTCSVNMTDKGEKMSQHLMLGLWDDKRCSSSVVSTTEPEAEKTKEVCNKVVPPLRLKKVVREASTTDEYRKVKVNAESRNELNYRIVTGATPRPESPSGHFASFWSSVSAKKEEIGTMITRDKSRRSLPKCDGYKIKFRRNRLRQKLLMLRSKADDLSLEMAARNNDADTSPRSNTRLRQMMNCYDKQIENVTKLLYKLSDSIPSTSSDVVVDLDHENELETGNVIERRSTIDSDDVGDDVANGMSGLPASVSPSPSPEPPKLSPRSPVDYEKSKSPDKMRNSPPVLPRVYITIQPTSLERLKKNLGAAKSWHESSDDSLTSSIEKDIKVDNTDRTIIRGGVTNESAGISPVSSSEFESPVSGTADWDGEEVPPKLSTLKNSEIEKEISEDTKTFDDAEERRCATPSLTTDNFLGSTINIGIDGGDARVAKEPPASPAHLNEAVTQISDKQAANKQVSTCDKQESERSRLKDALPASSSIHEGIANRKSTEYGTYDSEERLNGEGRTVPNTIAVAQKEAPTMIGRPQQVSASNITNIVQLQSNYYGSSVARDNVVFTGVIQNPRSAQKVTSSVSQSVALDPTIPLAFAQSGSTVSSSNQQCVVLPNSCNSEVTQENISQRNDGNRIMTEQFPTLGNWVARMSKKQTTKSKSKLQSGVNLPTASTAEVARIPGGLEAQKVRASAPNNVARNNIVNVAPQWNTERWQRQQHQQRQQLYAAASSTGPAVRPGICPPLSVAQFYPPNYAIDPYGSAAFGYHSAICPYGDYSYHSRLHATAPPINGYQIPLQDPHASSLRQMQHLDKRFPHLQEAASRHHFTTDLLKYPTTMSTAGSYQHTATGLDYDRLRTATTATQNGTAAAPGACLPPLLLPPPPPLPATTQQTLARTASLAAYPPGNSQCGRNRMIPDVVAAAAAAAVFAAASIGRQRGPLPPYERTDTEMVSGSIGGVIDNESAQLMANRATNRERNLSEQVQSVTGGVNVDSRLNNSSYRQLQNLILDRLPYVKTDDSYAQPAIFGDNAQEAATSSVSSSTYTSKTPIPTSGALISKESGSRKDSRNCDTPHLGKVNRTLGESTSNLECSNCGLTGSMFKCLGCEAAFYCDERCQTRHWNIHVEKCPKRMPKLKKLV